MNEKVAVAAASVANIWNPPASKSLATSFRAQAPAGVYTISVLSSSTRIARWAATRTSQSCKGSRNLGINMGRLQSSGGEEVEANVHVLDSQEHEEGLGELCTNRAHVVQDRPSHQDVTGSLSFVPFWQPSPLGARFMSPS